MGRLVDPERPKDLSAGGSVTFMILFVSRHVDGGGSHCMRANHPFYGNRRLAALLALALAADAPGSALAQVVAGAVPIRIGALGASAAAPLAALTGTAPLLAPSMPFAAPALTALPAASLPLTPAPLAALPAAALAPSISLAPAVAVSVAPARAAASHAAPASARALAERAAAPLARSGVDAAGHLGRVFDASANAAALPVFAAASDGPAAPPAQSPEQMVMLRTLKQVASLFTEHYAPIEWKQSHLGVDFRAEYEKVRAAVLADPTITQQRFQALLANFVASSRDYHAGIGFYSTESAGLPLTILGADGKYFIASIDRAALPEAQFPYEVGDEIVEFGGRPVAQAAAALTKAPNTAETDARLSELGLTRRSRRSGSNVPQGQVALKVKTADGRVHDVALDWKYKPEMIPADVPVREGGLGLESAGGDVVAPIAAERSSDREAVRAAIRRLIAPMAHPDAPGFSDDAKEAAGDRYAIGGKKSFVPALGEVVWELPEKIASQIPFTAAIYKDAQGRRIGYLRIPDYGGDENAAGVFAQLIGHFEQETDALVLDQVNNPGGSVFYMYALLSMLSDKPLVVPQHRLLIDEGDAMWAAQVIQKAQNPALKKIFDEEFEAETEGLPLGAKSGPNPLVEYAKFILSELKAGRRLTGPVSLFGVSEIPPAKIHYTKPVFALTNELDFSAADFLPTILQDNARATLFGVRTAGAGGAVKSAEIPNQVGIEHVSYTWTIAQRRGGNPVENLGVTPDVHYAITAEDIRDGFSGYKRALLDAIASRVPAPTAPTVEDPTPPAPRETRTAPKTGPKRARKPRRKTGDE
jgi:hypothetical protein